ncbi:fatty acid desaturase [Synechococcus lacustris]|uniref:fatty acid desaturase n=1 Tax=Synechococcus lacustris TaxID=2116544 RepID=UPI0028F3F894|nr:fatty acid desaturase [Synechococcus lacustris]
MVLACSKPQAHTKTILTSPVLEQIRKRDFSLRPYLQRSNKRAFLQIASTLLPIAGLWLLLPKAFAISPLLVAPILVLLILFSSRCFSLMHDCGHQSLFRDNIFNHIVGFILGVINAIPQHPWSRGHAYHHRHNGNWDLYRGPSALITSAEYASYSPWRKRFYQFLRHPLMLFPGGFFYLIIKPRAALILGSLDFAIDSLRHISNNGFCKWQLLISNHRSRHWYTASEFWHILGNNICVVAAWVLMGSWLGLGLFWVSYSIVMTTSAAIMICFFFVQHNFEGSYAHTTNDWDSFKGDIEGSSFLKMNRIFNWFSADIGYHNVHHLCEGIPNYNLRACHEANAELLKNIKVLNLVDIPSCFNLILWDRDKQQLATIP